MRRGKLRDEDEENMGFGLLCPWRKKMGCTVLIEGNSRLSTIKVIRADSWSLVPRRCHCSCSTGAPDFCSEIRYFIALYFAITSLFLCFLFFILIIARSQDKKVYLFQCAIELLCLISEVETTCHVILHLKFSIGSKIFLPSRARRPPAHTKHLVAASVRSSDYLYFRSQSLTECSLIWIVLESSPSSFLAAHMLDINGSIDL